MEGGKKVWKWANVKWMQFTPLSNSIKLPKIPPGDCRMFPSGLSLSCNTPHHPTSWDRNPFQQQCYQQPQRDRRGDTCSPGTQGCFMCWTGLWSHLAANGLLLTCCIHCVRRRSTSRRGGDYSWQILRVLYHMLHMKPNFSNVQTAKSTWTMCSICLQGWNKVTR